MNLGELRLKALQSLKRPYSPTVSDKSSSESVSDPVNLTAETTTVTMESATITVKPTNTSVEPTAEKPTAPVTTETLSAHTEKEEGELTDDSVSESSDSEIENDSNSSNEYQNYQRNRFGYSKKPAVNNTWTRWSHGHQNINNNRFINVYDEESDPEIIEINEKFNLKDLNEFKANLLSKLDETQSLLAATEEREHDLMEELRECRDLQRKCDYEKFNLERKLEKIEKRIGFKEKISIDLEKEVSKNNFKRDFVGKLLKETYMRSFGDRFRNSNLCRMYCETLKLDPSTFEYKRIDPMKMFCTVELIDGKCPYETCSMQHFEEIKGLRL